MRIGLLLGLVWGVGFCANATFEPLNPVPVPAAVVPDSVGPGDTANLSYSAALATSCAVTQSGCQRPPALPAAGCTGMGPQQTCSASVTATVPADALDCTALITVTCQPGGAVSNVSLKISGAPPVGDCSALKPLPTPTAGKDWKPVLQSRVRWGDGTLSSLGNARDYLVMWTYPGNIPAWPGNSGGTTRPTGASPYMYFTEKFTVPADYPVGRGPTWSWTGSGINSNASATISLCPGDFGQLGTQVLPNCRMNKGVSSSGLRTFIATTPLTTCTLAPGKTYYLNFLPEANLPKNPYDLSVSQCDSPTLCSPWFGMTK